MIKHAELKRLLSYNPRTGEFRRLVDVGYRVKVGQVAGWYSGEGYRYIGINHKVYRSSRLAWLWMTGKWPRHEIDHKNGVIDDDRFSNLRDVPKGVNLQNRCRANKNSIVGLAGVSPRKSGTFQARIRRPMVGDVCLGTFKTAAAAHRAYLAAKRELHPGALL